MGTASVETVINGRYEVGAALGAGGMGTVHAGQDERLRRPVAIKLLRSDLAADTTVRRRFRTEACAAARITHPNVVAVYDTGEHDGVPYIVMERLSGRTLCDEMAAGPLPVARATAIATDVLNALGAAHEQGVLHRDIKPANILLAPDGAAKVGDFGIAKVAQDADVTAATVAGTVIGTPCYVAPERLRGEPATVASDIYGVGVVLYEMLTGTLPFQGETAVAAAHAILHADPTPLRTLRPEVSEPLAAVVDGAMARDPRARYSTAATLADALAAATHPDDHAAPVPQASAPVRVNTAALPAGALAAGTGAAVTGTDHSPGPATSDLSATSVLPMATTSMPTARAAPAPRRSAVQRRRMVATVVAALLVVGLVAAVLASRAEPTVADSPATTLVAPTAPPPQPTVAPPTTAPTPVDANADQGGKGKEPKGDKKGKGEG